MGYYSEITLFEYPTDLSEEEFEEEKRKFLEEVSREHPDRARWAQYYLEELRYEDGHVAFRPDEAYGKFYEDDLLAEFVARTIKPGEVVEFYQRGEDGEEWGYRIERGKVIPLNRVASFLPSSKAEKATVAVIDFDLDAGTLELELADGTRFETVVIRKNGKLVSLVPNWLTAAHVADYYRENFSDEEARRLAQRTLELAEKDYGSWLAEGTADNLWVAINDVVTEHESEIFAVIEEDGKPKRNKSHRRHLSGQIDQVRF
ncbi:hypothetical protein [Thermosulfurimonas sp. F29]|uniref:hypothetical protein n=1 Tax=Thermosulfurimonas sp. F29 TaxID=2867247 RepID=UPI001C82F9BD|nr:hypothetical protein [Thermosulfurimonas sp. F29]MBX6424175.1 hypothetical protein [Thermosulfurimonas sp. F29]